MGATTALRATPAHGRPTASPAPAGSAEGTYLLRLCLDLKIDALLLALAAAAARQQPGNTGEASAEGGPPDAPWQRWLHEDVQITQALAGELLARDGGLPTSLAAARTCTGTVELVERLAAFHGEIRCLLSELEAAGTRPGQPELVRDEQVRSALRHCRRRLTELELYRLEVEAAQTRTPAPAVVSGLPGEFLG